MHQDRLSGSSIHPGNLSKPGLKSSQNLFHHRPPSQLFPTHFLLHFDENYSGKCSLFLRNFPPQPSSVASTQLTLKVNASTATLGLKGCAQIQKPDAAMSHTPAQWDPGVRQQEACTDARGELLLRVLRGDLPEEAPRALVRSIAGSWQSFCRASMLVLQPRSALTQFVCCCRR